MFDSKPGGRRRKERPRMRWLENVEKNLREINVNRWRQQIAGREEWVSVITQARALRELYNQGLSMRVGGSEVIQLFKRFALREGAVSAQYL